MRATVRVPLGMCGVVLLTATVLGLAPPVAAPGGPDPVDYVVVQRDPGPAGAWVSDGSYYAGETEVFWLVAYSDTSGWIGPILADWSSDVTGAGDVWPRTSSPNTTFAAGPGTGTVRVHASCGVCSYPTGGSSNATGPLTVRPNPAVDLAVRDAPDGGGAVVADRTYSVGDADVFWAAGYDTGGSYTGDLLGSWSVDAPGVCDIPPPSGPGADPTGATFRALAPGTCVVSVAYEALGGPISNRTGVLTVLPLPTVYVDDDAVCGGNAPCFPSFRDALAAASDGDLVIAYPGTYAEHVVVDKRVRILGLDRAGVVVDGGGTGTVFSVRADGVEIGNVTIANGTYGLSADRVNGTRVVHTTLEDSVYGVYLNGTRGTFLAWNLVTRGSDGIRAERASDDAVWWNEISHNAGHGVRTLESSFRNGVQWNDFHRNGVALQYESDTPVAPFEFAGNVVDDNDVGVRASGGPVPRITGNAFRRNGLALDLAGSDPDVGGNTFESNALAVRIADAGGNVTANRFTGNAASIACARSAVRIEGNYIAGGSEGVNCTDFAGVIGSNTLFSNAGVVVRVAGGGSAVVRDNVAPGQSIVLVGAHLREIATATADVLAYDSAIDAATLEGAATLYEFWTLRVTVLDLRGEPVEGADVRIVDRSSGPAAAGVTDAAGLVVLQVLGRETDAASRTDHAPFSVTAVRGALSAGAEVALDGPSDVTLTLRPAAPQTPTPPLWASILAAVLGAGGIAALMRIDRSRFALSALLLPLSTRIGRKNALDDYTRGRVFQHLVESPGDHFHGICRALGLGAGTVTYHLEVLRRNGLVSSRADGMYRRFYPAGARVPEPDGGLLSEVQMRIVSALRDLPGITQKELARLLGVSPSSVNRQVACLTELGAVRVERRGRHVRYYAVPSVQ